jgi:peptidoglycan/xylan/chitin deacetylase (PgdA/CDA1 family)
LTTSTRRFTEHLSTLKRHYPVLGLSEAVETLAAGRYLGPNLVVITFDDGYADNHDIAAPILERFGLPATFFLTVGFLGTSCRFAHDLRSPHTFANLSWNQVRSLEARGFEIGSHGWSHRNLAACTLDEARDEILRSGAELTRQLGPGVRAFAYPFGARADITPEVVQEILQAGFTLVLSAYGGVNDGRLHYRDVLRTAVADVSDVWALRAKVEGVSLGRIRELIGRRRHVGVRSGDLDVRPNEAARSRRGRRVA